MQKNSIANKVAMITGSARRIGAEISRTLHQAGMNIILHYNASEDDAIQLCDELNAKRANSAVALQADLHESDYAGLIKHAVSTWDNLYLLVNNASRFYRTNIGKVSDYAWDDLINSNLKAPFFLAQAAAPFLASVEGSIINITDIYADLPMRDYPVYCISKGALVTMTKVLAKELAPLVRVNAVAPGAILWPEGENSLSEKEKQKRIEHTLLARPGSPADIAKTVLFLVRDADYINGQIIHVDGGRGI